MKIPLLRKPTLHFLGLDMALGKTGIVKLTVPADNPPCKTPKIEFQLLNTEKTKLTGPQRWIYIRDAVREFLPGITFAAIEGYSNQSMGRAKIPLAELGGIIRLELYLTLGNKFIQVPPLSGKAFSGNGAAKKKEVIANVKKYFGFVNKDDNVCDAFSLAKMAQIYYCRQSKIPLTTENSGMIDFQVATLSRLPKYLGCD